MCLQEGAAGLERGSGALKSLAAAEPPAGPSLPAAGASLAAGGSGGLDDVTGRSGSLPVNRSASTKSDEGKDEYTARVRRVPAHEAVAGSLWSVMWFTC